MRIMIFFTALLLPWTAYDLNLFQRRRDRYALSYATHDTLQEQKAVKKFIKLSPVPSWLQGQKKVVVRMKVNHFSSKSRDLRDSNQRMIRRKFNNM